MLCCASRSPRSPITTVYFLKILLNVILKFQPRFFNVRRFYEISPQTSQLQPGYILPILNTHPTIHCPNNNRWPLEVATFLLVTCLNILTSHNQMLFWKLSFQLEVPCERFQTHSFYSERLFILVKPPAIGSLSIYSPIHSTFLGPFHP
jgi:hypothetical protein